jgi:hypothetical protein
VREVNLRFASDARALSRGIVVLAFLGIVTMPLLPWVILTVEVTGPSGTRTVTCYLDQVSLEASQAVGCGEPSMNALAGDLLLVSAGFWLALVLGLIGHAGSLLYRTGRRGSSAVVLTLLGTGALVGALLSTAGHLLFIGDLSLLEASLPAAVSPTAVFGYNYAPALMSVLLVLLSTAYVLRLSPFAVREAAAHATRRPARAYGVEGYGPVEGPRPPRPQGPPPPRPEDARGGRTESDTRGRCPHCRAPVERGDAFCSFCGGAVR